MGIFEFFKRKKTVKSEVRYKEFFERSFDAVALVDSDLNVTEYNFEFANVFLPIPSVVGDEVVPLWVLFSRCGNVDEAECRNRVEQFIKKKEVGGIDRDVPLRALDGLIQIGDLKIVPIPSGYMFIFRNTMPFRERESVLLRGAQVDDLTGLLNRQGLIERLRGAIDAHDPSYGFKIGVLFLDLDGFKFINDTYGHGVGDDILMHVDKLVYCAPRLRIGWQVRWG